MGHLFKRGNVYWIKYYRNGKPYRESTKSKKEADAKRLLKRREGEISEGKLPGVYFDRVRFDELAEGFLADYRINGKRSIVRAERSVQHLKTFFEGARVTNITSPAIQKYIEKRREQDAANATINRELAALKRMLNLGARQTPPKVDRVPFIPMLQENNVRKGFFEHGEFLALRDALPDHLKGFVTFGYKTGWRFSEIAGLTWNQIDLSQNTARLEAGETKNREGRTVWLDDEVKAVIQEQWEQRKKTNKLICYVFTNKDGDERTKDFRGAWRSACKKAGLGHRLFHDLRRTAVRNMVRAGVPERVAMTISGHKTRSVFERYNIVDEKDLQLAAERQHAYLESRLGTKPGTIALFPKKQGESQNG
jgi:integrase